MRTRCTLAAALVLLAGLSPLALAQQSAQTSAATPTTGELSDADRALAKQVIDKAVAYLRAQQDNDSGGWGVNPKGPKFPAITALVISGMMDGTTITEADQAIANGNKFILNYVQKDGGIYDQVLPSYNTAISVSALSRFGDPRSKEAVKNGLEFLKKLQYGEGAAQVEGMRESAQPVGKEDSFYGGWGYGNHGRPDLSNSAFAIEALHAAGVEPNDPAFARALVFLQRTQMLERAGDAKVNDMPYAAGSSQGGFIYATSVNKDRVGIGQSPAGEAAESLSGPPGTVAHVRLRTSPDGKDLTMNRDEVRRMLAETAEGSSRAHIRTLSTDAVILLGPTSDGQASNILEIRTPLTSAEELQEFLFSALAGEVKDREAITVKSVEHWKAESRLRCYGSMTYAGFKSYLYANLKKDDPRVRAAWAWIGQNYTLAENPGVGTDGLYYYYLTFARALKASGESIVPADPSGGAGHAWKSDLIKRLAELQEADGSFKVVDNRWMEDNKTLITAYSLIALREATR